MFRKTIIFSLAILLSFGMLSAQSPSVQNAGVKYIKSFYAAYVKAFDSDDDNAFDRLLERSLTPELREKVDRIIAATDGDPILRAQDVPSGLLKTLKVEPKGNDWYMVSYASFEGSSERVSIPMKLTMLKDKYYISYITPEWNQDRFGDQLLYHDTPDGVDQSTPLSFLRSFYTAYAATYCQMPEGLSAKLDALREKYCTDEARHMIDDAVEESESNSYDLLIGYYDFDPLWLPTIKVAQQDGDRYVVSYAINHSDNPTMTVTVVRRDGKYLIDAIEVDE